MHIQRTNPGQSRVSAVLGDYGQPVYLRREMREDWLINGVSATNVDMTGESDSFGRAEILAISGAGDARFVNWECQLRDFCYKILFALF